MSFFRCCLVLGLTIFASCKQAVSQSEAAHKGSVWVADMPGKPGRLYLCGTIHILREEDYPLASGYDAAYAASGKLVFELPPGAGDDSAVTNRMRELGTYPAGETLESHVSPETWAEVKKWTTKRSFPIAAVNTFRPWFLALVITSTEYAALDAKANHGVDQHFEERAKKDDKPGEGLETAEFQIKLFTALKEDQQKDLLEQTLAEVSTLPEEYKKMITAWKDGDLATLHEMLFREAERYPELMDLFLNDRNRTWIDPLVGMLKKGDKAMVLVGTGHLAGETGLLKLLENQGYRVRHFSEMERE